MLNAIMIIACPACKTRYAVPDSAIGVDGRTVRCAKCRHSWFQDGPTLEMAPPPAPSPPPVQDVAVAPAPAPASVEQAVPFSEPEPVEVQATQPAPSPPIPPPLAEEPMAGREPATVADESNYDNSGFDGGYSRFAYEPPFRARRNPAKMWMMAASLFAVVALGATAAVAYYGLPDWVPLARPTFAEAQAGLVLEFPPNRQDRRTLPNGTEFFGASGTITNVGREARTVPPLLIVLRDRRERIVYSWEVAAPKRRLAPGESVTVNEAVTDVPKSAKFAEIGWKPA